MRERRSQPRKSVSAPVVFRILRDARVPQISEPVEARILDLSTKGLALETSRVEADGVHISYNDHPGDKNRVYLQWELRPGKCVKAIGETVWYERTSTAEPSFVVGLRFRHMSEEDARALSDFLKTSTASHPLSL